MQPRIYTYKITFEEVPYYYYGSKKEKRYDEYYMGSPKTNKWCWKLYTPKKQILEIFDYTDEGYEECIKVENRLIKPVFNDPWCLNERCNNLYSLKVLRECGKKTGEKYGSINGLKTKENKTGIFSLTKEQLSENGKKAGKIGGLKTKELGLGIFSFTPEQLSENGKKGGKIAGQKAKENKTGCLGRTKEQMTEDGKKGGKKLKELGLGIFSQSKEKMIENGRKVGKVISLQKWKCLETGYITNAGALSKYQKTRNIDTSKRVRVS